MIPNETALVKYFVIINALVHNYIYFLSCFQLNLNQKLA